MLGDPILAQSLVFYLNRVNTLARVMNLPEDKKFNMGDVVSKEVH